jgi:ribonucleoside-triphosphate reductase
MKYTGGTVLHLYMGERISDIAACKKLVRRSLEQFGLPYITVTPTFSICPTHGYIAGEHKFCPNCEAQAGVQTMCEIWTRVMGYHRPIQSFNDGKKSEFAERVYFDEGGKLFDDATHKQAKSKSKTAAA